MIVARGGDSAPESRTGRSLAAGGRGASIGPMQSEIARHLRRLPHFDRLPDDALAALAAGSRLSTHARGEPIVTEGAPANAFFVITKGGVRVFRVAPDGRVQVLHRLGAGNTFAEAAVLTMNAYPASAEATRDGTEILHVGAETFLRLFDQDRRLPRAMVAGLCTWLRRLLVRVEELSVTSAGARLARYLLDLPARDGADGLEVTLPITKRELAEQLAITPETLSRQLRRWRDEGLVATQRARIVLRDPPGLLRIAGES